MPSRRQPQPPDTAVGRQEMIVLSFTLLHTPHTPSQEHWYRVSMASSTLGRGALPNCISKCGRKESAIRVPFLHRTLASTHVTSRSTPPPDWCALEPVIMPSPRKAMLLQHRSCEIEELVKAPFAGDVHDLDASYGAPLLVP